nr:MAG TPA: ATPase [Caudoviricetes sp.]
MFTGNGSLHGTAGRHPVGRSGTGKSKVAMPG